MYARDGVEIDPGATGYWMGSIVDLLASLSTPCAATR